MVQNYLGTIWCVSLTPSSVPIFKKGSSHRSKFSWNKSTICPESSSSPISENVWSHSSKLSWNDSMRGSYAKFTPPFIGMYDPIVQNYLEMILCVALTPSSVLIFKKGNSQDQNFLGINLQFAISQRSAPNFQYVWSHSSKLSRNDSISSSDFKYSPDFSEKKFTQITIIMK